MGIKDIAEKAIKKITHSTGEEDVLEDFDKELEADLAGPSPVPEEEFGELELESDLGEEIFEEPVPAMQAAPPARPAPPVTAPPVQSFAPAPVGADTSMIASINAITNKLELLEMHLEKIESRQEVEKSDSDRIVQYLTLISEKLDHLERENAELERLIKGVQ